MINLDVKRNPATHIVNGETKGLIDTDPVQFRADTIALLTAYEIGPALMDVFAPLQSEGVEIPNPAYLERNHEQEKRTPLQRVFHDVAEKLGIPNDFLPVSIWHKNTGIPEETLIFDPFQNGRNLNRYEAVKCICELGKILGHQDANDTCMLIRDALPEGVFADKFEGMSFGSLSGAAYNDDYSPFSIVVVSRFVLDGQDATDELATLSESDIHGMHHSIMMGNKHPCLQPEFYH